MLEAFAYCIATLSENMICHYLNQKDVRARLNEVLFRFKGTIVFNKFLQVLRSQHFFDLQHVKSSLEVFIWFT